MKTKKLNKKLVLNKKTIAQLTMDKSNSIRGGLTRTVGGPFCPTGECSALCDTYDDCEFPRCTDWGTSCTPYPCP
jgi:hypothetical protein